MYKQNFRLKNISYISSKASKYNTKPNFYTQLDDQNYSKRGKSSQYSHYNNSNLLSSSASCSKTSLGLNNKKKKSSSNSNSNNDLSNSRRNTSTNADGNSRKGYFSSQDIDEIIKASSSYSSLLGYQYQYNNNHNHKKSYSGVVTEANNKKSNNSSSDYLLASSSSSSSAIGKNKANALRNINVFYSELSKHLKREGHHNNNSNNISNRHSQSKGKQRQSNINVDGKVNYIEDKVNSPKHINTTNHQPSTKETKESAENNKKDKGMYCGQTRNIRNEYTHSSNSNTTNTHIMYSQHYTPKDSYICKSDNQSKLISSNDIDTPEELHYLYVRILQNGKRIEINFDKEKA